MKVLCPLVQSQMVVCLKRGVVGTHGYFLANVGNAFDYILAFEDIMGASRIM